MYPKKHLLPLGSLAQGVKALDVKEKSQKSQMCFQESPGHKQATPGDGGEERKEYASVPWDQLRGLTEGEV